MSLRIFMFSPVEPADRGGVQSVYRRLGDSMRRRGHTVVQAWLRPDPQDPSTQCHALPPPEVGPMLRHPRKLAGACRALLRLCLALARFRPHVVNCHFLTAEAWYFVRLKPIFRYRLVLSAHGSDVLRPKAGNAPWIGRILAGADAVTAVSRLTAARLADSYGVPASGICVIHNGIDTAFWSAGQDVPLAQRPLLVLAVGRLHPVKGHDVLIEAFASIAGRLPDAQLVIVGDGGFEAELVSRAGRLGIAPRVTFAGAESAEAVRERMKRARCFVLPSRSEGLPLALLEAMAAGVPVVASRVGGIPEVVDGDTAALVPPEDPAALASALVEVLSHARTAEVAARASERARSFTSAAADGAYADVFAGRSMSANSSSHGCLPSRAV